MGIHYCNERCLYNDNPDQVCNGSPVSHVARRCLSWRPRPHPESYRDLMKTFTANCDKNSAGGGYKSSRVKGVLK